MINDIVLAHIFKMDLNIQNAAERVPSFQITLSNVYLSSPKNHLCSFRFEFMLKQCIGWLESGLSQVCKKYDLFNCRISCNVLYIKTIHVDSVKLILGK